MTRREDGNVGLRLSINVDVNMERFMWKQEVLFGKKNQLENEVCHIFCSLQQNPDSP